MPNAIQRITIKQAYFKSRFREQLRYADISTR
ncbi:MAG: hypothetical protein ACJAV9_000085, partial [Urechidicola sp.]